MPSPNGYVKNTSKIVAAGSMNKRPSALALLLMRPMSAKPVELDKIAPE